MAKKVLLIDDERDLLDMLEFRLKAKGYEMVTALNGQEGLEKAMAEKPDVILLDVMMPGMDGFEVCRRLKEAQGTKGISVIFFTAIQIPYLSEKCAKLGAADCIVKPFESEEIIEKIEKAIGLRK